MTSSPPIVYVVDDDDSLREALARLLQAVGLDVQCFAGPQEFLSGTLPDRTSCLVLDVRLPGGSGLSIQDELAEAGNPIPIIFLTGHADVPMTVRAMKRGAADFLTKPFRDQELLDAVQSALKRDEKRRSEESSRGDLRAAYATLTKREREVLALVTAGLMNKQIAGRMALAEITVKIHRSHVYQKLGVRSAAELVKIAQALGIESEE
jgi:FixJ family two-component response regulator